MRRESARRGRGSCISTGMRIITHNAYWFQGAPPRWGRERIADVPEVFAALVELYRGLQPDVLCLQEVHRAELVEKASRDLGMPRWLHSPGGVRRDYGGAILSRLPAKFHNCTSLDGRPHDRYHLRASVERGGETTELAVVHLPSDRFATSSSGAEAARLAELEQVLAWPPPPDAILGDMNCVRDSDTYQRAMQAGYRDAADAGVEPPDPRRVDHVWLGARLAGRLRSFACVDEGRFVRAGPDGQTWRLSDHPVLVVELE